MTNSPTAFQTSARAITPGDLLDDTQFLVLGCTAMTEAEYNCRPDHEPERITDTIARHVDAAGGDSVRPLGDPSRQPGIAVIDRAGARPAPRPHCGTA